MLLSKSQITREHLREYLDYNPDTGHLTWIKKLSRKVVVGSRAGCLVRNRDSRIIKIFGEVYAEHRIIWLYVTGYYPQRHEHIDHIDHREDNNSWSNLRLVSQAENNKNLSRRSTNTLGCTGVWVSKVNGNKKFIAEITLGEVKRRASFYTQEEAITQRKQWERELGFHTNHGIVKPI